MLKDLKSFYHHRLKEINKLHEFRLDFTDGCKLRSFKDEEQKGPDEYNVVFYNIFQKKKLYLNNNPDNLGIVPEMAEFSETIQKRENVNSWLPVGNWYMPYFIRYLKPIFVDVFYDEILVFSDALDCKHKLINFELFPKNEKELFVWMNVIEKFKKEMPCDIAVKNDITYDSTEFDHIIDVKVNPEEDFRQHYLGLKVGRFYLPDPGSSRPYGLSALEGNSPHPEYHPDGLKNKNSLEIIEDILYYSSTHFMTINNA